MYGNPILERLINKTESEIIKKAFWIMNESGAFSDIKTPPEIKEKLDNKEDFFEVEIDKNRSQALSLSLLSKIADSFFKAPWYVLLNKSDTAFLTSDFPIKHDYHQNKQNINSIPRFAIPITPKILILIDVSCSIENIEKLPKNYKNLCGRII